jgi:hypothetical protein
VRTQPMSWAPINRHLRRIDKSAASGDDARDNKG